jgi:ribosomal protein L11 methyltransferase
MLDTWIEISCEVPAEFADVISDYLTQWSGNGVCVDNQCVDAFSTSEIPDSVRVAVKAYIVTDTEYESKIQELTRFMSELSNSYPEVLFNVPVISTVRTEDWSNSWKVHFKPLRVGRNLLIVPTWEDFEPLADDLVIRIDPGMAFGTGGHETTRLCLELLEGVMANCQLPPDLLDLGTGSGILAMAAALLGAQYILALDIDPEAVKVAEENIMLNKLSQMITCATTPIESLDKQFNVVLANILAEELVRLAPNLSDCLVEHGYLILSGILTEKESLVRQGFSSSEFKYISTLQSGEWVALLYQKIVL